MGTPAFAVPSLRALRDHHEVIAVYTKPDAVSGRGNRLRPSPVKEEALAGRIPVFQPKTLRDEAAVEELASLGSDVIVVAAYGLILPQSVLDIPRYGALNVHGSLLPRWRGAAPVERALLAGDETVGVAIMRMEAGLDTGPYCVTRSIQVGELDASAVTDRLATLGADALIEALSLVSRGQCEWVEQDETLVTYADKMYVSDVALAPELSASNALRRIRASSRRTPSKIHLADTDVTVVSASADSHGLAAGTVGIDAGGLVLGFVDGSLRVERVKPAGKAEMDSAEFVRGARIAAGTTWAGAQ